MDDSCKEIIKKLKYFRKCGHFLGGTFLLFHTVHEWSAVKNSLSTYICMLYPGRFILIESVLPDWSWSIYVLLKVIPYIKNVSVIYFVVQKVEINFCPQIAYTVRVLIIWSYF